MEGVQGCHEEERGEGGALGGASIDGEGGEDLPIEDRPRRRAVEEVLHPLGVCHVHPLLLQGVIEVAALDRVVGIREVSHDEPDWVPHGLEVIQEPKAEEDDLPDVPAGDEGALQLVYDRVEGEEEAISDDKGDQLDITAEEGEGPVGGDSVSGLPGLGNEGEEALKKGGQGGGRGGRSRGGGGRRRGEELMGTVNDLEEERPDLGPESPIELKGEAIQAWRPPRCGPLQGRCQLGEGEEGGLPRGG
jgi:hypothetical protein